MPTNVLLSSYNLFFHKSKYDTVGLDVGTLDGALEGTVVHRVKIGDREGKLDCIITPLGIDVDEKVGIELGITGAP
jgi:hypothetical protein